MIPHRFCQFVEKEQLFSPTDFILVALSGGADSVALLRLLIANGYTCQAAHCNFHLRGEESNRDEQFVRHLCAQLRIPLATVDFDTQAYAENHHISIEMAARELRYNWFEKLRNEVHADWIAVAHHQDDSVETFLLNLIRGTGINGLQGIKPKNGRVIRPLLTFSRAELENYLQQIGQTYVTDSTNLCDQYTRNKIRLKLLPAMEEINPSIRETLLETAKRMSDVATLYHNATESTLKRIVQPQGVHIPALLAEPTPDTLLFEWLHPLGFNQGQLTDIKRALHRQAGRIFYAKGWKLVKDREWLLIERLNTEETTSEPPFELIKKEVEYTPDFRIPKEKKTACFDADKITTPITLRKWKKGDSFIPFGMKGRKKISDYLTDRKFSLLQKEKQWVLCAGDEIAWVIGERIDNRFCIDEQTRRIVIYQMRDR